jgi:hypothetical protein
LIDMFNDHPLFLSLLIFISLVAANSNQKNISIYKKYR